MSNDEIDRLYRIAKALAMSRMFKDVTQAEQAFAKILLGRDLGISPTRAMMSIDLVRGNIQMRAVLMASFVREHVDYDYRILEHTEEKCSIEFSRYFDKKWEVMGVSTFTIEDAKQANLIKKDGAWETAPRNMVFARAMSNGVRWWCPDALGGIPVYTEGDYIPEVEVIGTADDVTVPTDTILPPAAERILVRARELGHDGLADRVTAEMTLKDQPEEFVADWCKRATEELDEMLGEGHASRNAHAEEAPEERGERAIGEDAHSSPDLGAPDRPGNPPTGTGTSEIRHRANEILDRADVLRMNGDPDSADELTEEGLSLLAEADLLEKEGTDATDH